MIIKKDYKNKWKIYNNGYIKMETGSHLSKNWAYFILLFVRNFISLKDNLL